MKTMENVEVLFSEDRIRERVAALGQEITEDFKDKSLLCIGVLKGCFPFVADLLRKIELSLEVDFLGLSSYGARTESSGVVRVTNDLSMPIEGKDVLIIEDIVDTGLTMQYLLDNLETRNPHSVSICTLLHKPSQTRKPVPLNYVGFEIPNKFVVGYGLDYAEIYRNLPYIGVVTT